MSDRAPAVILERLAQQLVMSDLDTDAECAEMQGNLRDLAEAFSADGHDSAAARVAECLERLGSLHDRSAEHRQDGLAALTRVIDGLGAWLDGGADESKVPCFDGAGARASVEGEHGSLRFERPEWIDEVVLQQFVSQSPLVLEEFEGLVLELDDETPSDLASIQRLLHTLKGESGVLGFDELERMCHGIEDWLEDVEPGSGLVDPLLRAKDWIGRAIDSYARGFIPIPLASTMLARLSARTLAESGAEEPSEFAWTEPADGAPEPPPFFINIVDEAEEAEVPESHRPAFFTNFVDEPPAASASESDSDAVEDTGSPGDRELDGDVVVRPDEVDTLTAALDEANALGWDADTIELVAEFLQESTEELARADQILLSVESDDAPTDESINALFRVFHTIKGVSGFLELDDITRLAHTTETMLNRVREGSLSFDGTVLDLVFDSTDLMTKHMTELRHAVERSRRPDAVPGLDGVLRQIDAVISGEAPPSPRPVQAASPNARLGEVLVESKVVSQQTLERALISQTESGRPIGEELIAKGAARPKEVARALRTQKKSGGGYATPRIRETVKVDLERIDRLVEMVGELVIVETMVVNAPEIARLTSLDVKTYLGQLTKITRDLQGLGMHMRMVPLRGVFQKMARMVRDLSRKSCKDVNLALCGEGTEMDRNMVEQIGDPLVHMIRNAMDHGIEPPDERQAAGKPAQGSIELSAYHEGGNIVIELKDDGRGLDRERILAKARSRGLVGEQDKLTDNEIYNLIFAPGFSTASQVTELSGRGVGMDVVKRNIEAMRGRTLIESSPGAGTTFRIILPLTLAIIDGMLVSCGEERYILPTLSIVESIQPDASMLVTFAERHELLHFRGAVLPLVRLSRLLGVCAAHDDPTQGLVIVVETVGQRFGLAVDNVLTQQQVVIKNLGSGMHDTPFVSGATILSDGSVGLILNVEDIAKAATAAAGSVR